METLSRGRPRDAASIWVDMGPHPLSLILAVWPTAIIIPDSLQVAFGGGTAKATFSIDADGHRCDSGNRHECSPKNCRLWKLTQRAVAELRKTGLPIPEAIETYDRRLFILNADTGGDPDFLGLNDHPKARGTLLGILVDKSGEPMADTAPETLVEDGGNLPQEGGQGDDRVPRGPFQGHRYRFLREQDIKSLITDNETNYLRLIRAL